MIKKIMMKQYFPTLKKDETEGVMSELEAHSGTEKGSEVE